MLCLVRKLLCAASGGGHTFLTALPPGPGMPVMPAQSA